VDAQHWGTAVNFHCSLVQEPEHIIQYSSCLRSKFGFIVDGEQWSFDLRKLTAREVEIEHAGDLLLQCSIKGFHFLGSSVFSVSIVDAVTGKHITETDNVVLRFL
jgi:hypothetical protein